MAATMCEERVGAEVRDMLDESIGIGNMRWYFENLTRQRNPEGNGFLVCLVMNMDDSPMVEQEIDLTLFGHGPTMSFIASLVSADSHRPEAGVARHQFAITSGKHPENGRHRPIQDGT